MGDCVCFILVTFSLFMACLFLLLFMFGFIIPAFWVLEL